MSPLFTGRTSLRDRTERLAFWLTLPFVPPALLIVGYALHESIGASQVALFVVLAMLYVTLARGRLLGTSVMVHEAQYPRVFAIVKRACAALEIPLPLVFVREDNFVPVAALGFGEPYALVISSHWIETFADDELAFMIGRELGHIAAGHTPFLSLLSVGGNENPIIAVIFGAWLRRCAITCDRIGLLCCGSIDAAIRAIAVSSFHEFGRRIDYTVFAEQSRELENDAVFRFGTWLGAEPYATVRIAALRAFLQTSLFEIAQAWFLKEKPEEPPSLPTGTTLSVQPRDCAGWWRRFAAFAIDFALISSIFGVSGVHFGVQMTRDQDASIVLHSRTAAPKTRSPGGNTKTVPSLGPFTVTKDGPAVHTSKGLVSLSPVRWLRAFRRIALLVALTLYLAILVTLAGQSFGMTIVGIRVVGLNFERPNALQSFWRYLFAAVFWLPIALVSFVWRRTLLHDWVSATRVVTTERALARAAARS
ncbi:MAG: RDD family protein [Vulcanimicrobiaceae bacterium]